MDLGRIADRLTEAPQPVAQVLQTIGRAANINPADAALRSGVLQSLIVSGLARYTDDGLSVSRVDAKTVTAIRSAAASIPTQTAAKPDAAYANSEYTAAVALIEQTTYQVLRREGLVK